MLLPCVQARVATHGDTQRHKHTQTPTHSLSHRQKQHAHIVLTQHLGVKACMQHLSVLVKRPLENSQAAWSVADPVYVFVCVCVCVCIYLYIHT